MTCLEFRAAWRGKVERDSLTILTFYIDIVEVFHSLNHPWDVGVEVPMKVIHHMRIRDIS